MKKIILFIIKLYLLPSIIVVIVIFILHLIDRLILPISEFYIGWLSAAIGYISHDYFKERSLKI